MDSSLRAAINKLLDRVAALRMPGLDGYLDDAAAEVRALMAAYPPDQDVTDGIAKAVA